MVLCVSRYCNLRGTIIRAISEKIPRKGEELNYIFFLGRKLGAQSLDARRKQNAVTLVLGVSLAPSPIAMATTRTILAGSRFSSSALRARPCPRPFTLTLIPQPTSFTIRPIQLFQISKMVGNAAHSAQ